MTIRPHLIDNQTRARSESDSGAARPARAVVVYALGLAALTTLLFGYVAFTVLSPQPASPKSPISLRVDTWRTYENYPYHYTFKYPPTWRVGLGDPPDDSRASVGPTRNFRPLIFVRVVRSSELESERQRLLLDTTILRTSRGQVAGIPTEEVNYVPFKGAKETVVIFSRGNFGFIVQRIEGGEEEDTESVFEQILSTFRFIQ